MANLEMQKSSNNTADISAMRVIMGIINSARLIQGWAMLPPKDAEPLAQVWLQQLRANNVDVESLPQLLNEAVSHRIGCIASGDTVPPLTIETVIAMSRRPKLSPEEQEARDSVRASMEAFYGR